MSYDYATQQWRTSEIGIEEQRRVNKRITEEIAEFTDEKLEELKKEVLEQLAASIRPLYEKLNPRTHPALKGEIDKLVRSKSATVERS